ncbi:MAG: hypothetical protein LBU89_05835, partial [Fibromonadaceae bacterium]|nr:hypothetical protein [Fibromonadaceae bacterium]
MFKAMLILFIPFFLSCGQGGDGSLIDPRDGKLVDPRDGQRYRITKIGELLWMAENLNYKVADSLNSWCYDDDDSNCEKYGRLYDW